MKRILLLIIVSIIFSISSYGQTVHNLNLSEYGSMTTDIVAGNGYIFVYAPEGINIFNAADNSFVQTIKFDTTGTYGKFNPVFFDSRIMVRDQSLMAYSNETNHKYLYALTPSSKLLIINTDNFEQTWIVSLKISKTGEEYLDNFLDSQSGRAILKYDESGKRLFMLVAGRDRYNNCTGNFHGRFNIFAFYDIDYGVSPDNHEFFNLHFVRRNTPEDQSGDQINNYAIFNKNNNNYFTLVRLGLNGNLNNDTAIGYIDTYRITGQDADSIENDHIGVPSPGATFIKMGKMLVIPEINKIVTAPYKFFVGDFPNPYFCVMDYSNPENVSHQIISSPSKKILSTVYLNQNNDLILGYEPDSNDVKPEYQNTNLAVYHYNNFTGLFGLTPVFTYLNDSSENTSSFDFNSAVYLTKINSSTALISKKDGIGKIEFNGINYTNTENILGWDAESNFFGKSVISNNKVFICNYAANGLEIYNINGNSFEDNIRTGYPVYKAIANSDGSIILFYNTLNTYNTGMYAYNTETGDITHLNPNITSMAAIGDCKYNRFADEFVITEFRPDYAKIIRLDANRLTKTGEKLLTSNRFSKELFVSPEGYLYVATDVNNQNNMPKIKILDAADYAILGTIDNINDFGTYDLPFAFYSADFNYNPYDRTVNVLLTVQEKKLLPYNTVSSNIYGKEESGSVPPPSKMIVISKDFQKIIDYNFDDYGVKMISPYSISQNKSSQYYGKCFVAGEKFYMVDYKNNYFVTRFDEHPFVDISYDTLNDVLFAIKETYYINGNDSCEEHRQFEVWKITMTDTNPYVQFEKFNGDGLLYDGQVAGMFYNPYDTRIYVYRKTDAEKLGTVQENLMSFSFDNPVWETINLGNKTYFPDYDHTRDLSQYYMNNDITPYIDPYQNKIYLPNGGHSNVSVVDFEPCEPLNLCPGTAWFSFPRLEARDGQGKESADIALNNNIIPQNFFSNGDTVSFLENVPIGSVTDYYLFWDNNIGWDTTNSRLKSVNSHYGYKITLKPDESRTLFLKGTVEDPSATTDLKCSDGNGATHIANWIGYFLYRKQSVFDALGTALNDIFMIKHQNYTCYRYHYPVPKYCGTKSTLQYPAGTWICSGKPVIKYGDMIIVYTLRDIDNFQWHQTGSGKVCIERPQPAYYVYKTNKENPEYSTFVIELDTTRPNPVEIGAFINDTCIGSTTVLPTDSVVVLRGYIEGHDDAGVSFEQHYASRAEQNKKIKEYYVLNPSDFSAEKRSVKANENKSFYLVSFVKKHDERVKGQGQNNFIVFPNPAEDFINYSYRINTPTSIKISIYNMQGVELIQVINRKQETGYYNGTVNLKRLLKENINKGIYLIKFTASGNTTVKKVVVN